MKLRIYTDISIFAGCVDPRLREDSCRLVNQFLKGEWTMVISDLTIRELEKAQSSVQKHASRVPVEHTEILKLSDKAIDLAATYSSLNNDDEDLLRYRTASDKQTSVVRYIDSLLVMAINLQVNEIHIDSPPELKISFLLDGELEQIPPGPRTWNEQIIPIVTSLSQSSNGRIMLHTDPYGINVRIGIEPKSDGEGIVVRILDQPVLTSKITLPERKIRALRMLENPGPLPIPNAASKKNVTPDLLHVALATIAEVNEFDSWNPQHIAPDKISIYDYVNLRRGYSLFITSPEEPLVSEY